MSYGASALPATTTPTQRALGGKNASTVQQKVTVKPPTYDLASVSSDWTTFRNIRQQFDQDVIVTGFQLYRQQDPTTPYLKIPGENPNDNLAKQVVAPLYTFAIDKCQAYNTNGETSFRCPAERSFASPRNLKLCEDTVRAIVRLNEVAAPDHWSQSGIHYSILHYGEVCGRVWYDPDGHYALKGIPIKLCLDNPLAVAHELDADGTLRRVITAHRVTVGELYDEWKKGELAGRPDTDEVVLFQDLNKVNFAAIVDNQVVDQYAHGFTDLWGNPMVPYVIEKHMPMIVRQGDSPPQLGYSSPREISVGRPVFMGLIPTVKHMSFYLTAERYDIRENLAAWEFISGDIQMDYNAKRAIDRTGQGKFQFVAPQNILSDIERGLDRTSSELEMGAGAAAWMSGQPTAMSGVSQQGQTQLPKAFFEAARRTHERFLQRIGLMILAMVKTETQPSQARKFKASTGRDLTPYGNRDYSPDYSNEKALPYYYVITGDVRVPIDALTVAGVTEVVCGIQPVDTLPKEQAIQLFMNVEQLERQSGRLVVPKDYKFGELLGVTNPQGFIEQIDIDQFESDPNSPTGKVRLLRGVAQRRMAEEGADPQYWTQYLTRLDQIEEQAYRQQAEQQLMMLQQGGGGQPPAQPGPPQSQIPPSQPGAPPPAAPPAPPPGVPPPPGGPVAPFGSGQPMQGAPPSMPPQIQGVA